MAEDLMHTAQGRDFDNIYIVLDVVCMLFED